MIQGLALFTIFNQVLILEGLVRVRCFVRVTYVRVTYVRITYVRVRVKNMRLGNSAKGQLALLALCFLRLRLGSLGVGKLRLGLALGFELGSGRSSLVVPLHALEGRQLDGVTHGACTLDLGVGGMVRVTGGRGTGGGSR